jgi:hypothetical protein
MANTALLYKRRKHVEKKVDELEVELHRTMTLLKKWRKKLKYYDRAIESAVKESQPTKPTRILDL